jgi:RNA exonuclease 1
MVHRHALVFYHPRRRPLKHSAWLTRKWLGRTMEDRGPGGHNPEEDAGACVDFLNAKIKNGTHFYCRVRNLVDDRH